MKYFVSDIHGEYELLNKLLDKIGYSANDTLYVLGDMIDKGNDSVKVLKQLSDMPNAYCILGNHEYDFLKYYRSLMKHTTDNFDLVLKRLQEYLPSANAVLTWDIVDWLDVLPSYISTSEFIGVHAGVPLDNNGRVLPLETASVEQLVYDRNFKSEDTIVQDNRTILYGHTPTSYLNNTGKIIRYLGNNKSGYSRIHLDTGVYLTGILGCYSFDDDKCFYARKSKI